MSVRGPLLQALQLLQDWIHQPETISSIDQVAILIANTFRDGKKVYAMGNGGSLADASHFAEELTGKFRNTRPPLPAIAFSDPAHLTCVANDFGFEAVFSRMVEAFCDPHDIVLILTTSGMSANLIQAAKAAIAKNCYVIALTGRGGGDLRKLCNLCIDFPGETSDRIQELQMLTLHAVIQEVERLLGF